MEATLPPAITLKEFGAAYAIPEDQLHRVVRQLPPGTAFRIGKRWRVLIEPLKAWIASGGSVAQRGA